MKTTGLLIVVCANNPYTPVKVTGGILMKQKVQALKTTAP